MAQTDLLANASGRTPVENGEVQPVPGEVPAWPALAPNVQLTGEMPGTGFQDRQWLIQRDGQFIQVTELLYRVAEQCDGERTLAEIAEGVTEATDWMVEADDVRRIIQAKLMPLGLVATADGASPTRSGRASAASVRSPLTLNMRVKTLSPRVIHPITRVLQVLFAPALLIPILAAAAYAHWWLYHAHGISAGVEDALTTPGGLLLVLAIVIVAGMFHEFGHAAALRYGGGKVRGMGAGLYLIYPALYTDVTDSYRLGRWARVRTDLGGVYFHLVFALGLIALSVVTGWELLLFAVVLIDLMIVGQFVPFVRFDGYWTLADLTGIPDFFSQMVPFVRSILPVSGSAGSRLPKLRPWVRVVFGIYILAAVPVLTYLFCRLVAFLPRFLARMWNALAVQMDLFPIAQREGDLLTMLLIGTQVLLLLLPVMGAGLILYGASRTLGRSLWHWSRPTPARRIVGAFGAAAGLALVGLSWVPQVQELRHPKPARSRAILGSIHGSIHEPEALLQQTREATKAVRTLRADLEGALGAERFTGTVLLQRPNRARIEIQGNESVGEFRVNSDGRQLFVYFPSENRLTKTTPGPEGEHIRAFVVPLVDDFFRPARIGTTRADGSHAYRGRQTVDGAELHVVEVVSPGRRTRTTRCLIGARDHLVREMTVTTTNESGGVSKNWVRLKNLRIDEPVDGAAFEWAPPSDAGPLQLPEGVTLPLGNLK